jgi:hypothetical protein
MKTLVIVGSAPLDLDFSRYIDSCDCVVRFNNCKNYGGNSGRKTDILILNNAGDPRTNKTTAFLLKPRSRSRTNWELPYLNLAKEVWFTRPEPPSNKHPDTDITPDIIEAQKIDNKRIRRITHEQFVATKQKLARFGRADSINPSTGMLGIEMLLDDPELDHYQKRIIGFSWEGWPGHSWELEKQLVNAHLLQEVLFHVDPKEGKSPHPGFLRLVRKIKNRLLKN